MSAADIVVRSARPPRAGGLGWFFFATRGRPHRAVGRRHAAGGGCRARRLPPRHHPTERGIPVELVFDRRESGTARLRRCWVTSRSAPRCPRSPVRRSCSTRCGRNVRVRVWDEHGPGHLSVKPADELAKPLPRPVSPSADRAGKARSGVGTSAAPDRAAARRDTAGGTFRFCSTGCAATCHTDPTATPLPIQPVTQPPTVH